MIKVGIVGGTGYTGVELLRLLAQHPNVELQAITSRSDAGTPVSQMFTSLRGRMDLHFVRPEEAHLEQCDVVFFATPNGIAMQQTRALLEAGVPGVVVVNWYGLMAPKNTPKAVINRIATETTRAVQAPVMMKHLIADGSEGIGSTSAEFTAHIRAESEQWRRVIKEGGIRAE